VTSDCRFQGEDGPSDLAGLFGDKQTLAIYRCMFEPQRTRPCPMCTSLLGAWEGNAADLNQRISLPHRALDRMEARTRLEESTPRS
jgi:predicted dithiol-disulfide oxidoreductase (DUF899 family)